jgi:subtilisin family serine protease
VELADPNTRDLQFDPQLRELFLRLTGQPWSAAAAEQIPDQRVPVVARLRNPDGPVPGLDIVCRFRTIVTGRVLLRDIVSVRTHSNVASLKASQQYARELASSVPAIHADPASLATAIPGGATGQSVIVGIADWGFDFAHENFRGPDGRTRIVSIWDQRDGRGGSAPAPYGYGREILADEIEAALAAPDPYAALGYDPVEVDPGGIGTHGAHVADIAAGNGSAPGSAPGVAPEASLIFIHLRGNDTDPRDTLGDSVRLLEAVHYIAQKAAGRACAFNLSLGRTGGPKDGTTLVEQGLDELVGSIDGLAAVMSTGNYRVSAQHAAGRVAQGKHVDLPWRCNTRHEETAELEIWYGRGDSIGVEVIDPFGERVGSANPGEEQIVRNREGEILASIYNRVGDPNNGDNQVDVFLWPEAALGTWRVRLHGLQIEDGRYNAYIERDDPESQSRFLPQAAETLGTTNTICNGRLTIAVGACDARVPGCPPLEFSSAGPTRDGRVKPDCVAPGGGIRAARSSSFSGGERVMNGVTLKSGTSMAAPHVTGLIALMFEAAAPLRMPIEVTRRLLFRSCRSPTPGAGDFRLGAGIVDAAEAVRLARSWKTQQQAARTARSARETEDYPMALIDSVRKICGRLAGQGWRELMLRHGLDIGAADLAKELAKPLTKIDRKLHGFEDFAAEGTRGIEPGIPARSLLYHALASGGVTKGATGGELKAFPTLAEINTVENYVYAARRASFDDIAREFGKDLAIVVFTVEHRSGQRSPHRRHADLAFSRCGIARSGTEEVRYRPELRSFTVTSRKEPTSVCVTPARYAAFLAARRKGASGSHPMHFQPGDDSRQFWIPVHKLFSGAECLKGLDLKVSMRMCHYNEKLKRLRIALGQTTGIDLDKPPFTLIDGLAEWGDEKKFGPGLVVPVVHKKIVDFARLPNGKFATYRFDTATRGRLQGALWSSWGIPTRDDISNTLLLRSAPEWIHVRHALKDGKVVYLGDRTDKDIDEIVRNENYDAVHFVDFTAEGWIEADVKPLPSAGLKALPAYSVVAAPDFFPYADQLQLTEWAEGLGRPPETIWYRLPTPLCDNRIPFDLQVPGNRFDAADRTGTAIVSQPYASMPVKTSRAARKRGVSWLPDAAAGLYAPGWDVTLDATLPPNPVTHLSNYGLGSPFPEDAQLCAALNAFWPAVAPDTARKFHGLQQYTVAPLTEQEIEFDTYTGPRAVIEGSKTRVELRRGSYTDYVKASADGRINYELTAKVGITEYKNRVLAMIRVYDHLKANTRAGRAAWRVLSFKTAAASDAERTRAQQAASVTLSDPVYRIELVKLKPASPVATQKYVRHDIEERRLFFVQPGGAAGRVLEASMAATAGAGRP